MLITERSNAPLTSENEPDLFDVELEDDDPRRKRADGGSFASSKRAKTGATSKRAVKDAKYGFGGKKRHSKSGDAFSSADMSSLPGRKAKGKPAVKSKSRPGKSKRAKARL
jgi:rRNA-processing protein EBP2